MSATLTVLRARARQRADMPATDFIADDATGIDAFINEGCQILHEKLVSAFESEYVSVSTTLTTSASGQISLPADFYKLYSVDMTIAGRVRTLLPYMRAERNAYRNIVGTTMVPRYRVEGGTTALPSAGYIKILPVPATGTSVSITYAPQHTVLVNGSDNFGCPNGWERYVVLYTAIQMLVKEESDVSQLRIELEKMEDQLKELALNRNADQPARVIDMDLALEDGWW